MTDILQIDDGSALDAAKKGKIAPLLNRLKQRLYLNDESLAWISDRLEGKRDGRQKTGGKHEDAIVENLEMHGLYQWLIDVEKFKEKEARYWLQRIYGGKDDTIRKNLNKLNLRMSGDVSRFITGLGGDRKEFLATKNNNYRPKPLQKFGTSLSKK